MTSVLAQNIARCAVVELPEGTAKVVAMIVQSSDVATYFANLADRLLRKHGRNNVIAVDARLIWMARILAIVDRFGASKLPEEKRIDLLSFFADRCLNMDWRAEA